MSRRMAASDFVNLCLLSAYKIHSAWCLFAFSPSSLFTNSVQWEIMETSGFAWRHTRLKNEGKDSFLFLPAVNNIYLALPIFATYAMDLLGFFSAFRASCIWHSNSASRFIACAMVLTSAYIVYTPWILRRLRWATGCLPDLFTFHIFSFY